MAGICALRRSWISLAAACALIVLVACSDGPGASTTTDSTAPTVNLTSAIATDRLDYVLTGTATDDVGVVRLTYRLNAGGDVALEVAESFDVEVTLREGVNDVRVDAFDAAGNAGFAELTVSVTINSAPVAESANVTLDEDTPAAITLAASDAQGDVLSFTLGDGPAHGTLSGSAPNLTYTPDADYNGPDSFGFRASDGLLDSASATVSLEVSAVNDAPDAEDIAVTTDEDVSVDVRLNASDVDGDPVGFRLIEPPAHGQVDFAEAPTVTYTPDADYNGPDSFGFVANDGGLDSDLARVDLDVRPVNDAPVAVDDAIETREDTPVTFDLVATDVDTPSDALTITVLTQPDRSAGVLDVADSPTVTFVPSHDYSGATSFRFEVDDGAASDTATVTITVRDGSVVFVDVAGSDSNNGYSAEEPLRTVGAAIALADRVSDGELPDTIRLAPGRYCEPGGTIHVDRSVFIVGDGMDETVLDGSSIALDCTDPHADGYVTCDARSDAEWPAGGVVAVYADLEPEDPDPQPLVVELNDLTIANGLAEQGGGILNFEVLDLWQVRVADNCALFGGGIHNSEPGLPDGADRSPWARLTLEQSVVQNNRAITQGGGLDNASGRVYLTDSQVVGNEVRFRDDELGRAATGGGIHSVGGESSELRLTRSSVNDNRVVAAETALGGGIYASNSIDGTASVIEGNQALVEAIGAFLEVGGVAAGAGIYSDGPELTLSSSRVELNVAEVVLDLQELIPGEGGDGVAEAVGGGVYYESGALSLTRVRIGDNTARADVASPDGVTLGAIAHAGGLYLGGGGASIVDSGIEDNAALAVTNTEFEGAYSIVLGGGARFSDAAVTLDASAIVGNRAQATMDTLMGLDDATLLGGGVHVSSGVLTVTDTLVSDNRVGMIDAVALDALSLRSRGGGLFLDSVVVALDGIDVESNHADRGGGILLADSIASVMDASVRFNRASEGAGLYLDLGNTTISESIIAENIAREDTTIDPRAASAVQRGGGLMSWNATLDVFDTDFTSNQVGDRGGGLALESSDVFLMGCTIAGNVASSDGDDDGMLPAGGGIWAQDGSELIVRESSIIDNRAGAQGAGLALVDSDLDLRTSTVSGNIAAGEGDTSVGGALFVEDSIIELINCTLSGNRAAAGGAAIRNDSSDVNLIFTTIHQNGDPDEGDAALSHVGASGYLFMFLTLLGQNDPLSCNGSSTFSGGYNLDHDGSCDLNEDSDLDPTGPEPLALLLTPLVANGGPTLTHAPMAGSSVIDVACIDLPFAEDQRGAARLVDGDGDDAACYDIGAVEYP